ncbi:MAG: hypothetical protein IT167_17010 [Bryobacterales bacterium]|nr:hypothetical protein [Bryobacterales bacterium]
MIDLVGSDFRLTSATNGVWFDIVGQGKRLRLAWTIAGSEQGWLALDRNQNGRIDDGIELFGNHTPQPLSTDPSGFRALAVYDNHSNGGNGDGEVSELDEIYGRLVLWVDRNHDGVSQPSELLKLREAGIASISLAYVPARRKDKYGNEFRYRTRVTPLRASRVSKSAWDIFLSATSSLQMPTSQLSWSSFGEGASHNE